MLQLQPNQTLAFDGDSLTHQRRRPALDQWPWLRLTNNHRSWADIASELLFAWRPELNLNFRNTAVGGSNSRDLLERFDSTLALLRPDWTLLTLGTNDVSHGVPATEFAANLRDYTARIAAWGGQTLFVGGLLPTVGAGEANHAKAPELAARYAIEAEIAAESVHSHYLDLGPAFQSKAEALHAQWEGHAVYADGTHFSHLGALIIAGEVLKAFGVLLQ